MDIDTGLYFASLALMLCTCAAELRTLCQPKRQPEVPLDEEIASACLLEMDWHRRMKRLASERS